MHQVQRASAAPDYELRVPEHLRHAAGVGILAGPAGLLLAARGAAARRLFGAVLSAVGVAAAALRLVLFLVTDPRRRLDARRRMLDAVAWRGDERVLDVGCGNGFVLVEAARRLTTGLAT